MIEEMSLSFFFLDVYIFKECCQHQSLQHFNLNEDLFYIFFFYFILKRILKFFFLQLKKNADFRQFYVNVFKDKNYSFKKFQDFIALVRDCLKLSRKKKITKIQNSI